ncbi:MAG: chromosomal replication initiator protein DnaA [Alloprevotella sp.]|nr:chromosomal replication initiator protein DnaA [Bacteroidales bacterium]MDY3943532.1 chromosomal replication initiator protein DnaA [Alloprevotella sp.]
MSTPEEQWQSCLALLQTQQPSEVFNVWFKELELVSYEPPYLRVSVPNDYFLNQFSRHYGRAFYEALVPTFGEHVEVYLIDREKMQAAEEYRKTAKQAEPDVAIRQVFDSRLPANYRLSNFVAGRSNKTALAMGKAIVASPGSSAFNPFFLFGPSGVGKTHLAAGIGHEVLGRQPNSRVLFVTAREFQEQYTNSVRNKTQNDFTAFYQTIDVLILDDVQELTTEKTQLAFFHIFNHLQKLGRQIIFTCDRLPTEIEGLQERVLSRLHWGTTIEIERPDIQLRKDILRAKIRLENIDNVGEDVVSYIAEHISSNVRELHGTLNSLMAHAVVNDGEITYDLMERIVARYISMAEEEVTVDDIIASVAKQYGLRRADLRSKSRKQPIVRARQIAMYLCHKRNMSYVAIGKEFGKRDHSTVSYGCEQVKHFLQTDKAYRREVEELEASLKRGR